MRNKQKETERLSDMYLKGLKDAGVEVVIGRGELKDAITVSVSGRDYKVSAQCLFIGCLIGHRKPIFLYISCASRSRMGLEMDLLMCRVEGCSRCSSDVWYCTVFMFALRRWQPLRVNVQGLDSRLADLRHLLFSRIYQGAVFA